MSIIQTLINIHLYFQFLNLQLIMDMNMDLIKHHLRKVKKCFITEKKITHLVYVYSKWTANSKLKK